MRAASSWSPKAHVQLRTSTFGRWPVRPDRTSRHGSLIGISAVLGNRHDSGMSGWGRSLVEFDYMASR